MRQDSVLVSARFPRALYLQLERYARENMRSTGKEAVFLCESALREQEKGKQKQRANLRQAGDATDCIDGFC